MAGRQTKKTAKKKPAAKTPKKATGSVKTVKAAAKPAPAPKAPKAAKAAKPAKAETKAASGKVAPKAAPKAAAKKAPAKAAPAKAPAAKAPAPAEATKGKVEAPAAAAGADKKVGPKGITIVHQKPVRRTRPKQKFEMPKSDPLIKPGGPKWKPLIPSGPKATPVGSIGGVDQTQLPVDERVKSKLTKRELEQYRQTLMRKRAELVGDINNMEEEALRQSSGSLSNVPQHMAEQGTDTYDQGLSLDLAAVDRSLLRDIDDALKRIAGGTFGICERTGNPIKPERLQEIPWARYSIEAAREMERRPYQE